MSRKKKEEEVESVGTAQRWAILEWEGNKGAFSGVNSSKQVMNGTLHILGKLLQTQAIILIFNIMFFLHVQP